jgi:hypothetical protein
VSHRISWRTSGAAKKQFLASALLVLAVCVVACGGGDKASHPKIGPASTWLGVKESFCQGRWDVPTEVGGAGARIVLAGSDSQRPKGLYLRVENIGEEDLSFGLPPVVEKRVDGRWVPQAFTDKSEPVAFSLRVWGAEVGSVSRCVRLPIPSGWREGYYRLRMLINRTDDPAEPPELLPTAFFRLPGHGKR